MNAHLKSFATATLLALATVSGSLILTAGSAEAGLICKDEPIDTTSSSSRMFKYQPMKKSGIAGCVKDGPVKEIKMLIPRLPSGTVKTGHSRMTRADGCSGGGKTGRRLFHAACNAHDICYASLGVSKFKCEDMFVNNMLKIAKHGPVGSRTKALAFATAVGVGGHSSYDNGQAWAKDNYSR